MKRMLFMKLQLIICGALVCSVSGCARQTPQARSVGIVSVQVERALAESVRIVYDNPVELLTRMNPCACDAELVYEVQLYGVWRHVMIRGTKEQLERVRMMGASAGDGVAFEVAYLISDLLYVGQQGQKFYTLVVAP